MCGLIVSHNHEEKHMNGSSVELTPLLNTLFFRLPVQLALPVQTLLTGQICSMHETHSTGRPLAEMYCAGLTQCLASGVEHLA